MVNGIKISCWSTNPHGSQTLTNALENSCNPALIQLGRRITAPTLYRYYNAFGFFESTSSGLYGEQTGIFHNLDDVKAVELATMSFGQRVNVTPLQMITAISCIANDGVLLRPRIVKEITNTDTGTVTEVPVTTVRQVLSKQTADQVKTMMQSVVTNGSGWRGAVKGYSVGGKTGTSEPPVTRPEDGYTASYVAISPVEDTQIVLLLTLYKPQGANGHQGGVICGPVISQMLSEILPHLDVPSNDSGSSNTNSRNYITVPDIRNKTVAEAEKILKSNGFNTKTYIDGDANTLLVEDQNPKPGNSLPKGSVIILYGKGSAISTSVTVPDLKGMNASAATSTLQSVNLNINIEGSGVVATQDCLKDEQVPEGTIVRVTLK